MCVFLGKNTTKAKVRSISFNIERAAFVWMVQQVGANFNVEKAVVRAEVQVKLTPLQRRAVKGCVRVE